MQSNTNTTYNKDSLLKVLPLLDKDNVITFLQQRELEKDCASITHPADICDIVYYIVHDLFPDHQTKMYAALKCFQQQLSTFNDTDLLFGLIKRINKDFFCINATEVCLTTMRSAITSPSLMMQMFKHIDNIVSNYTYKNKEYSRYNDEPAKRQPGSALSSEAKKMLKSFFAEQEAYWLVQDYTVSHVLPSQFSKYDGITLHEIMKFLDLDTENALNFLNEHKASISNLTDSKQICDFVEYALSSSAWKKHADVINLFLPQFAYVNNSKDLNKLLKYLGSCHSKEYHQSQLVIARAARHAIKSLTEMAETASHFVIVKDRELFIKEQSEYLRAQQPAVSANGMFAGITTPSSRDLFAGSMDTATPRLE